LEHLLIPNIPILDHCTDFVPLSSGNGTSDQHLRPPGFGLLHENTTVTAQWIDVIDTPKESKKYGRVVNRVSLAMPHAGVFAAARYGENDIMQPEELNSEGTYSLRASVPSPVLNVLCANLNETEMEPIVYAMWPNSETVNMTSWVKDGIQANATTKNHTVVDELFGWTKKDDEKWSDYPPVFSRLPISFNTVMNHTSAVWGRESIYLLGAGANMDDGTALNGTYMVCKMHVTLTPKCTTQYNATGSGGSMEALCEDKDPNMAYRNSNSSEPESVALKDWRDVGTDWSNAMSLNAGISDGAASNARLLTQLMLKENKEGEVDLNPSLPSPAEALAVMAGCKYTPTRIPLTMLMLLHRYAADELHRRPLRNVLELHHRRSLARRLHQTILQRLRESATIRLGRRRQRLQGLDAHPLPRLPHEHPRPRVLPLPQGPRHRLLRAPQPLRARSQLAPLATLRRLLRRRPRRQAVCRQLVRQLGGRPSLHGARTEECPRARTRTHRARASAHARAAAAATGQHEARRWELLRWRGIRCLPLVPETAAAGAELRREDTEFAASETAACECGRGGSRCGARGCGNEDAEGLS
jgi:hypothetical protein